MPTREFLYQDLKEWVGRLYCRPGFEELLDRKPQHNEDGIVDDIWDAPIVRDLLGDDGMPFFGQEGSEGRLLFSFNLDGFNPYGNKTAGKKVTCCGMYMVCLNLPPDIRYNVENMFLVGIIPGPHSPSTHQINHVLRPVVEDLHILWKDGIFLTQTPLHPRGRRVRGALVPLVCDLPAARQMSGLTSHSHRNFCSECHQTLAQIRNLDYASWKPRSREEHMRFAEAWRNARTEKDRSKIEDDHGIRWSELLNLPYWDPTKFVVIDSMHGFYLRMFHRHVRKIWQMDVNFVDCDDFTPRKKQPTEEKMSKARKTLRTGSASQVKKLSFAVLQNLCKEVLGDSIDGDVQSLQLQLLNYVRSFHVLVDKHYRECSIFRGFNGGGLMMLADVWRVRNPA